MSIPARPIQPDLPESVANELHALYRDGANDEPDRALDRRILDAAHAELQVDHALQPAQTAPWWKSWRRAISSFAVLILGLSVTWSVMDEEERALRNEFSNTESLSERADRGPASRSPTEPATTAKPVESHTPTRATMADIAAPAAAVAEPQPFVAPHDNTTSANRAVGSLAQPAAVADVPAEARVRQTVAGSAAPPPAIVAPAPALAMPSANLSAQNPRPNAGTDESNEKKLDAGEAVKSFARPEAAPRNAEAPSKEADAADDAATPQAWLDHIRKLHASGRTAQAAQSLERFRKRYPGVVLPDDLPGLSSR